MKMIKKYFELQAKRQQNVKDAYLLKRQYGFSCKEQIREAADKFKRM